MDAKTKICSRPDCQAEWPATEEYFARDKDSPDGLRPDCKVCTQDHASAYYAANRFDVLEQKRQAYLADIDGKREYYRKYRAQKRQQTAVAAR
jgi:hypothetical protein